MAPALALGALLASLAVLLSYAAGLSLLYGSRTIPMALPTAVSLVLLSCGILAAAGPLAWPLILLETGPIESTATRPRWSVLGPLGLSVSRRRDRNRRVLYIKHQIADARQTAEREVSTIADSKAAQIANWWRERHTDAEVIFRTPMIQARALRVPVGLGAGWAGTARLDGDAAGAEPLPSVGSVRRARNAAAVGAAGLEYFRAPRTTRTSRLPCAPRAF